MRPIPRILRGIAPASKWKRAECAGYTNWAYGAWAFRCHHSGQTDGTYTSEGCEVRVTCRMGLPATMTAIAAALKHLRGY